MSLDVDTLMAFLAVHRSGGFARAGEALNRSQPAISRRVAQLEDALGVPVFERGSGNGALSEAGQVLLPLAERALAAIEDCRTAIDELKGGRTGQIELAVVGTLAGQGLTDVLRRFVAAYPGTGLKLRTASSREVSRLVRTGEATIGLRYHMDRSADLSCEMVRHEQLVVICAPDHPKQGAEALDLSDLADETWIAFPGAANLEASADTLLSQFLTRGVSDLDWIAIDSLTGQKRLVEAGFGLALVPESAIDEEMRTGQLSVLNIPGLDAFNPVCLVARKQGYLSPAALALKGMFETPAKPADSPLTAVDVPDSLN